MKKLGLIALAVVVALGMLGIGYAYWTDSLTINATVQTGNLSVRFTEAGSDDDAGHEEIAGYDAASTIVVVGSNQKSASITINDAYPGYATGASITVMNTGTVPVKVKSINVVPDTDPLNNLGLFYYMTLGQWNFEGGQPAIGEVLMPGASKTFDADFSFDARPGSSNQMPMDSHLALTATIVVTQFNDPAPATVTVLGTQVIP